MYIPLDLLYQTFLWTFYTKHSFGPTIPNIPLDLLYQTFLWTYYTKHSFGPTVPNIPLDLLYQTFLWTYYTKHSFGPTIPNIPLDLLYQWKTFFVVDVSFNQTTGRSNFLIHGRYLRYIYFVREVLNRTMASYSKLTTIVQRQNQNSYLGRCVVSWLARLLS